MIRFNMHNITKEDIKVKVRYCLDCHVNSKPCVAIYAKEYGNNLDEIFEEAINNTDYMTDLFEKSRVYLFEDHPEYKAARAIAEKVEAKRLAKQK